ncbi:MAG TPA: hypothetical protein IGR89_09980 [Oscillatoriaceae cyanobacterium M7585_C2015_266]|nr:hypothetical protein [Oscillatoriaceae cyanobacterium M7585_C2015_266]
MKSNLEELQVGAFTDILSLEPRSGAASSEGLVKLLTLAPRKRLLPICGFW